MSTVNSQMSVLPLNISKIKFSSPSKLEISLRFPNSHFTMSLIFINEGVNFISMIEGSHTLYSTSPRSRDIGIPNVLVH